jgi:hypothetical protein
VANRAGFILRCPEFARTGEAQVEAFLADAALEVDADVWGEKTDLGIYYLTAHNLALSPYGNAAQMVIDNDENTPHGNTVYGVKYDTLVMQVSSGYRVA